jgi:hypothetical protein
MPSAEVQSSSADVADEGLRVGVVILTMGDRPAELSTLLESVLAQHGAVPRIVVVGNGAPLPPLPPGAQGMEVEKNLGVSGGRNVALTALRAHGDVDVVMYLDDDGLLPDPANGSEGAAGVRR